MVTLILLSLLILRILFRAYQKEAVKRINLQDDLSRTTSIGTLIYKNSPLLLEINKSIKSLLKERKKGWAYRTN